MKVITLNEENKVIIFGNHFSLSNNIYHVDEIDSVLEEHFGKSAKSKINKLKSSVTLNSKENPNEEISYNDLYLFLNSDCKSIVARTTQNVHLIECLSEDSKIVYDLIRNPNTPLFVFKDLAKSKDALVLQELICFNPNGLKESFFLINRHEILTTAYNTIMSIENKLHQKLLLSDLAQNEWIPNKLLIQIYSTTDDYKLKRMCLLNKNLYPMMLFHYFNIESSKSKENRSDMLIFAILQNPNTPEVVLLNCLQHPKLSQALKNQALAHHNMPPEILKSEYEKHKKFTDGDVPTALCEIARNPSTPTDVLIELSAMNLNQINYWLLLNPKITTKVLVNILKYGEGEPNEDGDIDVDRKENFQNAKRLLKTLNNSK